jgi:hypothetical protein
VAIDGLNIRGAADQRASSTRQPCSANPTAESAAPVRSSATSPSTRGAAMDAVPFIATLSSEVCPSDCKVNLLPDAEPADPQSSETHRRANGMTVEVKAQLGLCDIYVEHTQPPFAALGKVVVVASPELRGHASSHGKAAGAPHPFASSRRSVCSSPRRRVHDSQRNDPARWRASAGVIPRNRSANSGISASEMRM